MVEKSQTVLQEVASQLPLETPLEDVVPAEDAGFQIMKDSLNPPSVVGQGMFTKGLGMAAIETCLPSHPNREQERSNC